MADIAEQLSGIDSKIQAAIQATTSDAGASPVLVAVVQEFGRKSAKAAAGGGRTEVIELEQAGDSAKAAAEADAGASEPTRQAVLDAHLAICMLKAETAE